MHNVTIERATMRGIVSAMSRDKKREWMRRIHVQEDRGVSIETRRRMGRCGQSGGSCIGFCA